MQLMQVRRLVDVEVRLKLSREPTSRVRLMVVRIPVTRSTGCKGGAFHRVRLRMRLLMARHVLEVLAPQCTPGRMA